MKEAVIIGENETYEEAKIQKGKGDKVAINRPRCLIHTLKKD